MHVSQVELLRALHPHGRFPKSWPTGEDLSWDEHYEVLQWWGEDNDGLPVSAEGTCMYDVNHPMYGWVELGHFYMWSKNAIKDDKQNMPVKKR